MIGFANKNTLVSLTKNLLIVYHKVSYEKPIEKRLVLELCLCWQTFTISILITYWETILFWQSLFFVVINESFRRPFGIGPSQIYLSAPLVLYFKTFKIRYHKRGFLFDIIELPHLLPHNLGETTLNYLKKFVSINTNPP